MYAHLAPLIEEKVPLLAEEMTLAIRAEFSSHAQTPHDTFRRAVERGLYEFAERVAGHGPPAGHSDASAELHRELGRRMRHGGQALDGLESAYRIAARVAWQRSRELGHFDAIPSADWEDVIKSFLTHVDELLYYSTEGHRQHQAEAWAEATARRQQLLQLLVSPTVPSRRTLIELARSVGWELPRTVQAVALRPSSGERPQGGPAGRVPATVDSLACYTGPQPYLLLPNPEPDTWKLLELQLRGWHAAVGPVVPLASAPASLDLACRLLDLADRGIVPDSHPARCSDHLSTLLLLQDEVLLRKLTARHLSALSSVPEKFHDHIIQILLAWLTCEGNSLEIAQALQIDQDSVRIRMHQVQTIFGPRLRDPDARFELEMVLRARALRKKTELRTHKAHAADR
ncbi:helix-turn-helix domain-containing protein [Streptomyces sp. NPDC006733]|uniref:helix-turn-helix domain-containing protein n=1 Tax=Streptomyces sp. NPDC006733 TaxID=3155460 RepID=UPI0033F234E4